MRNTVLILLGIAVLIVISFFYFKNNEKFVIENTSVTSDTSENSNAPIFSLFPKKQASVTKTSQFTKQAYQPRTPSSIKITSPISSDKWIINENHLISWSEPSSMIGSIYLVSALNNNIVGWVTSETGRQQKSFNWNTKDVFINRYSGLKKSIDKGNYYIKIKFDENQKEISSPLLNIIYKDEVKETTYTIEASNFNFSPKAVTLKKGDKVLFINKDNVIHKVVSNNFGPLTLNIGESVIYETSGLAEGNYYYYDSAYPSMTGSIIIFK